jgi:hypothetical protein
MPIFPVPTRIENSESDKRDAALAFARRLFTPFLQHVQTKSSGIDQQQHAQYWNQVEIPYRNIYAFEEVPAAFKDEPGDRSSVLAPSERIAYWISGGTVSSHRLVDEIRRAQVVKAFAFADDESPRTDWAPASVVEPIRSAPRWKLKLTGNVLWQIASAVLAGGAMLLGVVLWSTSSQLAVSRDQISTQLKQISTQFGQIEALREVHKAGLDELGAASRKTRDLLKGDLSESDRKVAREISGTISTVRKKLESVP